MRPRPPTTATRPLRILAPVLLLTAVTLGGGAALFGLGRGRWSFADSLYMAINAVTTVGFREIEGMEQVAFSRTATVGILIAGLAAVAYFQSSLTAILVEGVIGEHLRGKRMQKQIDALKDHVIVAGSGPTGMHVLEELYATRQSFVAIDREKAHLERVSREIFDGKLLYVVGDATDDGVLEEAGVTRCKGVVAALAEDKDNLFFTLSARTLNPTARIVTKVIAPDAATKMMRAGANATVSPNMIGGRRLASEIVRPNVVEFLDQMMRDKNQALRFEEIPVPERSPLLGRPLSEVPTHGETNVLIVALRVDKKFVYNPEPTTRLEPGNVLVVLGEATNVTQLRNLLRAP